MTENLKNKMNEANKYIFVKLYEQAKDLLEELVKHSEGRYSTLAQLRRIELSVKLGEIKNIRDEYIQALAKDKKNEQHWLTCLYLAEQHGEMLSDEKIVENFQQLIKNFKPSAAAYFGIAFSMECQNNYERAIANYEQCLKLDPDWSPAYFGLSQIYYHLGNETKGDHYFYMFEHSSPYSLYGNFETHKALSQEFLEKEDFEAAEAAITALSDWWVENRGHCPREIQIYENFTIHKILELEGDIKNSQQRKERAIFLSKQLLKKEKTDESILYFVAKILEEFSEFELAFDFYKEILKNTSSSPALVQKIGSQFLAMGEFELAKNLFQEAYNSNPNQAEIRFCLLVSKLKLSKVNVEEYLIGRERLAKLVEHNSDKVEVLALLHALLAKFQDDPEVHGNIADLYLKMGDLDRAKRHFSKMFEIDNLAIESSIKYASFETIHGNPENSIQILNGISSNEQLTAKQKSEITWLKSVYYNHIENFQEALFLIQNLLQEDPWNVSYVCQEIQTLLRLTTVENLQKSDKEIEKILQAEDTHIDWQAYDQQTKNCESNHLYEIVYSRQKLRFLYAQENPNVLMNVVRASCKNDAKKGVFDFMRLLNTNFDSPDIYFALGILFKDLWQLETASMWFEQLLLIPHLTNDNKRKTYIELADCYIWRNIDIPKAIEYVKIALDLSQNINEKAISVLAHGYLKSGQMKEAKVYLDQSNTSNDKEITYIKGLYHYRNGAKQRANEIWKPLITIQTDNLRAHHIKQEMMKYYYDSTPYHKAN